MPRDACCQTEEFLPLVEIQDKLTSLYFRIKHDQQLKQEQADRIEYLEFKIRALEASLFEQQVLSNDRQARINSRLLYDVSSLQEKIAQET